MELILAKVFSFFLRRTTYSISEEILTKSGMEPLLQSIGFPSSNSEIFNVFSFCVSFLDSESCVNIHVDGTHLIPKGFLRLSQQK